MKGIFKVFLPFALLAALCMVVYVGCSSDDDENGIKPPPVTTGTLVILSTPDGAQIFIDDEDQQKQTPSTFTSVDSGNHTIKLTKEGYGDWTGTKRVIAGQTDTVNAELTTITYTLTITTDGNGTVEKNPDKENYAVNDTVELTATPDAGWQFIVWSSDLTGFNSPDTVVMTSDKSVKASFIEAQGADTARVVGIISYPGGTYVKPLAFVDTSHTDAIVIFRGVGFVADTATGAFVIDFELTDVDSIEGIITGWDDANKDGELTGDEPNGWWDYNGDGSWNAYDMVVLKPGPDNTIFKANVILYTPGEGQASPLWKHPPMGPIELK